MNATHHSDTVTELNNLFLIRVGTMGHIGRFVSDTPLEVHRGEAVVCRSTRGLERGLILGPSPLAASRQIELSSAASHGGEPSEDVDRGESLAQRYDGRILRRFSAEDHLLWSHLEQLGGQAHDDCVNWLTTRHIAATLLEVEPLLDGKTLFFHFLAEVPAEVQEQLDQLVRLYERKVRESKFARLLEEGCGPGCGTAEKVGGCGSTGAGCAICSIAKQCKPSAGV